MNSYLIIGPPLIPSDVFRSGADCKGSSGDTRDIRGELRKSHNCQLALDPDLQVCYKP